MSRLRILLAAILCVSLLTFVGCGENGDTEGNAENGTVTEESTDMNNDANNNDGTDNGTNNDGSVMEDMGKAADDAVDDLERDAKDAADGMRNAVDGNNGEGPNNRDKNTKESNAGQ